MLAALQVRIWHNDAGHFRPAYCIAVREEQRQIVLVVRGTGQLSDALTNLAGEQLRSLLVSS